MAVITIPGSHVQYPHQSIERVGSNLAGHSESLHGIASSVSGVKLAPESLGSIGANHATQLSSHIDSISPRIATKAEEESEYGSRLRESSQRMRDTDEESGRRFSEIAEGVTSKDNAPHGTTSSTAPEKTPGSAGATAPGGSRISEENTRPEENDSATEDRPACADPIDISTGRMMLTQTDVDLPGLPALVVSRTHLSGYRLGRCFGRSWASTLDQRIEVEADAIHFAADDGSMLVYPVPGADDSVLPNSGQRRPLTRTGNGGYAVLDRTGDVAHLFVPSSGGAFVLDMITRPNGQHIAIDRDASGTPVGLWHSEGHRVAVESENGLITALRLLAPDGEGPALPLATYRYDDRRRLIEEVNSSGQPMRFTYDDQDRIVRVDDRNGMWYAYVYDADGRCVRTEGAGGYMNYAFAYDRENLVTHVTDSLGHTTVFEFDESLRVARETDPLGNTKSFEWDLFDQLLSTVDPLGNVTRHEYDEAGSLVRTTWPDGTCSLVEYDEARRPVAFVEPDGGVWRREYTSDGLLAAEVDPTGARTSYAYDPAGNIAEIADALGNTTRYESNSLGLPVAATDALGNVTRFAYDMFGRPVAVVDPLGAVTSMSWTVEGKPAARVAPDGATLYWLHDGEGNGTVELAAEGALTRTEIAHFDLPVAETAPDGSRVEYSYDTELRLVAVTNEQGALWRYEYDAAGNLVGETDFTGRQLRYRYDAAGRLVERVNGAGQVVRTEHDALGRVVRRTSGATVTTFDYDPAGRIIAARNDDAEVIVTYDAAGRVVTEAINGHVVRSSYDQLGRRVGRLTPTGASSRWEYDAFGRPVALHAAGQTMSFGYDPAGREVRRQFGAAASIAQEWDTADRLLTQTVLTGADHPAQRRAYTYREDGLLTSVTDQLGGPRRFDLDPVGRVTAVHRADGSERYAYDPAGNLTLAELPGMAEGDREYANGLLVRAGHTYYTHDAEGRIVTRRERDTTGAQREWHYTWGAQDELIEVSTPDGQRWRYRYDPFGRRIAKQRLGADDAVLELIEFHWDGDSLVEQVHDGRSALTWDWLPDSFDALGQTERVAGPDGWTDERCHAIVTDLVGTPRELVAPDGTVALHVDTTLWGVGGASDGAVAMPLRFPGQYDDPETGLYYNFHRYYDPATARYATNDPLGLDPSPNPRAYVENPNQFIDPLGLMPDGCKKGKSKNPLRRLFGSSSSSRPRRSNTTYAPQPYASTSTAPYPPPAANPRRRRRANTTTGTPAAMMGEYANLTTHVTYDRHGRVVPSWDPTQGGLYPNSGTVSYAGQHSHTNGFSAGDQFPNHLRRESEHVVPSRASQLAGIPNYNERYEPTISIPRIHHQPPSGAGGLGGGYVSSTGSGFVPNQWGQNVAQGIVPSAAHPSGYSYYQALRMTTADEMNVNIHSAPGLQTVINQHEAMGRLTPAEAADLRNRVADRYYRETQYRYY